MLAAERIGERRREEREDLPQPKNTTPESRTNSSGSSRHASQSIIATPSSAKAINMVCSRPKRSEINPNSGRVKPLVKRSIVNASGSAAMPNTTAWLMPKSSANTAICEVTISPEVDIIAIMANISQNSGWRSISREVNDLLLCATV